MAAAYASERIAFGQPIGANQGIAHPLANDVIDADGGALLLWWTLARDRRRQARGAARRSRCCSGGPRGPRPIAWRIRCTPSAATASPTNTTSSSITAAPRPGRWRFGDPQDELVRGGRRLLLGEAAALPDPGTVEIDFDPPPGGEELAEETRDVFASVHRSRRSTIWSTTISNRTTGRSTARSARPGCCFPTGRRNGAAAAPMPIPTRASHAVWQEVGYAGLRAQHAPAWSAHVVLQFGTPELQDEVLLRFAAGEVTAAPRLHRAVGRFGRVRRQDPRGARRRRLGHQRPEDVHLGRRARELRAAHHPHRSGCAQAQGHHPVPRAAGQPGRRDPSGPHLHGRADQRDLLSRTCASRTATGSAR